MTLSSKLTISMIQKTDWKEEFDSGGYLRRATGNSSSWLGVVDCRLHPTHTSLMLYCTSRASERVVWTEDEPGTGRLGSDFLCLLPQMTRKDLPVLSPWPPPLYHWWALKSRLRFKKYRVCSWTYQGNPSLSRKEIFCLPVFTLPMKGQTKSTV